MKRHHYSYLEAENGFDALEAYKNSTSQFETILMDMSMPISKFAVHYSTRYDLTSH
jgi:CheY-like chemotaxis protein